MIQPHMQWVELQMQKLRSYTYFEFLKVQAKMLDKFVQ